MPEPSETHLGEGALGVLGVGLACAEAVPLLKAKARALLWGRPRGEAHPLKMEQTCSWGTCFSPPAPTPHQSLALTLALSLRLGNKGEKLGGHHRPRGDGGPGPRGCGQRLSVQSRVHLRNVSQGLHTQGSKPES